MDDAVWDVTVFTKNRERLITSEISQKLFESELVEARSHELLSEEHCTVDRTLLENSQNFAVRTTSRENQEFFRNLFSPRSANLFE
jgi:hypothetical protein